MCFRVEKGYEIQPLIQTGNDIIKVLQTIAQHIG